MSISLDGQAVLGHVYDSVPAHGGFGLLNLDGSSRFDIVTVETDD